MGTRPGGYYGPQPAVESIDLAKYELIRDEGMKHGKAIDFASALCDGIGPRLTGSPNMKKANEWARDTLIKIGLANAHLEDWGEFGMGWYQVNTWGRLVTPEPEPIWMEAAVWSPSTGGSGFWRDRLPSTRRRERTGRYQGNLERENRPAWSATYWINRGRWFISKCGAGWLLAALKS